MIFVAPSTTRIGWRWSGTSLPALLYAGCATLKVATCMRSITSTSAHSELSPPRSPDGLGEIGSK